MALILTVLVATPVLATPGDILYVEAESAALRAAPDSAAPVVVRLGSGHKLIEFERRGAWLRVGVFGAIGQVAWVRVDHVARRPSNPAGAPLPDVIRGPGAAVPSVPPVPGPADAGVRAALFRLIVSGSPAMAFAGECDLVGADGRSRRRTFAGLVPGRFDFAASAVRCRVRKRDAHGWLWVELTRDGGSIARAETRAAFNYVRVQSAGPWGAAAGVRGAIAIRKPIVSPEARGRIVPPLIGPMIPPLSGTIVPPLTGPMTPPLTGGPRVFQTSPRRPASRF